jgi:hypothetical protein
MAGVAFSCVVDKHLLYCFQGLVFAHTLIDLGGARPDSIVIHLIEGVPEAIADLFRRLGVRTVPTRPFDPGYPYSNKLVQLNSDLLRQCDYAVLCDCDIAFAADPSDWVAGDRLRAKPVDFPNPPLAAWSSIFAGLGIDTDFTTVKATHKDGLTYANNFNGGIYIIPQQVLEGLRKLWPVWNARLLSERTLLGDYAVHADQVSLAVAMQQLGYVGDPLPLEMNCPTHLPPPSDALWIGPPRVIHYHKQITMLGKLIRTGHANVDQAIDLINVSITDCRLIGRIRSSMAFKRTVASQSLRRILSRWINP